MSPQSISFRSERANGHDPAQGDQPADIDEVGLFKGEKSAITGPLQFAEVKHWPPPAPASSAFEVTLPNELAVQAMNVGNPSAAWVQKI